MSLRFIPNEAKLSPLKMFLKYAKDKEKQEMRLKKKKLMSLENFLYIRGTISDIFGFNDLFLQSILKEFNIKEKEPKIILDEILYNFNTKYIINGSFQLELFNNDYNNRFNFLSNKYNEKEEIIIVQKVLENNELESRLSFKNNNELTDLSEYKAMLATRKIEMEFLTMYLAKAENKDLNSFILKNENSKLINDIANRDSFIKLRENYQKTKLLKLKNKNKIKAP